MEVISTVGARNTLSDFLRSAQEILTFQERSTLRVEQMRAVAYGYSSPVQFLTNAV